MCLILYSLSCYYFFSFSVHVLFMEFQIAEQVLRWRDRKSMSAVHFRLFFSPLPPIDKKECLVIDLHLFSSEFESRMNARGEMYPFILIPYSSIEIYPLSHSAL